MNQTYLDPHQVDRIDRDLFAEALDAGREQSEKDHVAFRIREELLRENDLAFRLQIMSDAFDHAAVVYTQDGVMAVFPGSNVTPPVWIGTWQEVAKAFFENGDYRILEGEKS